MSAEAEAYVWRCSPLAGVPFVIHMAIADVVNDAYGFEFWMSQGKLATKARTTRQTVNKTLALMCRPADCPDIELDDPPPCVCEHRLLDELEVASRDRKRYRFRMPVLEVAWDPANVEATVAARGVARGDRPAARGVAPGDNGVSPKATGVSPHATRGVAPGDTELEGTEAQPPRGTGALPLDLEPVPATSAEQGRVIATAVWDAAKDAQRPTPATPYIAVAKIAGTLLDAGHPADAIIAAMTKVPTISTRWVEAELAKHRPTTGARAAVSDDRTAPAGRIEL